MKHKIIDAIIRIEGGYVNNPSDSGGETKFGITKAVADAWGYIGDMWDMPRSVAFNIYSAKYWDSIHGDEMIKISERVTEEVIDTSVNMGAGRAGKFLQRALNVLNSRGSLYADLTVDGQIGRVTLAALIEYLSVRDQDTLVKMLNCMQGSFYVVLAERREKDEDFIYGWFRNRVKFKRLSLHTAKKSNLNHGRYLIMK